ncbi:hypothetical protein [Streptomyces scabiei]|uniref:hypothetical protein n=1 Tax=Streptomyces scabiei TaxID=1930 RepID=UPI0029A12275|nr:hypothetical protein [Streptomyces scabiei]MDX3118582.1 hypothetical protein [Streptomyces scabiei]
MVLIQPKNEGSLSVRLEKWLTAPVKDVFRAIKFEPKEFWLLEWVLTIIGIGGGAWVGWSEPHLTERIVVASSALVGVIVGAVVAGMAIQSAGFDQEFLRKLSRLKRATSEQKDAVYYLTPFLYTAMAGVFSMISILTWSAIPDSAPSWLRGCAGMLTGGLLMNTFVSLIPGLNMLVVFLRIVQASASVPDRDPE